MPPIKLIVITIDDYGLDPFINEGGLQAAVEALITAVGVFATIYQERPSYSVKQEIDALLDVMKTHNRKIGIGVHLTMSSGQAITGERKWLFLDKHHQFQKMNEFKFSRKPAHLQAV